MCRRNADYDSDEWSFELSAVYGEVMTLHAIQTHQNASFSPSLPSSPPALLQRLQARQGEFWVVRDDLLEGGTKQRAVTPYLERLKASGYSEFVYASPFAGYAQVALASACRRLGLAAKIFCEEDQANQGEARAHAFAAKARDLGAELVIVKDLGEATRQAKLYSQGRSETFLLPLGFDDPQYRELLSAELARQFERIQKRLGSLPTSVWLPLGSGTLTRTFDQVLPRPVRLNCVDVHVLPRVDARLEAVRRLARVSVFDAPEAFIEQAISAPPIPSNTHYDAKLWRFLFEHARPGDVWWNVGP